MELKQKIINLYQEGKSSDEIRKELGNYTGYVYKVLGDLKRSKGEANINLYEKREAKRCEMTRHEKVMKTLLPFENEQAKDYFHELEKDISKLRTEISYLDRKLLKSTNGLI